MRFRAATVALLCALSTVDARPGERGKNQAPVDDGTNAKKPSFPKHVKEKKGSPSAEGETPTVGVDLPGEHPSQEDLQAAKERNKAFTSLLGDLQTASETEQQKDKAAKQVDAPGRAKKAEELVDLLGISTNKVQSELFTAMDLLASEEQEDETESLPPLESKEDASDEGKEFDGKMKTLDQGISSEEEDIAEDSDEEELELEKAENLIAQGKADVARLRKKLGLSDGEDYESDEEESDIESGVQDELIKAKKMVNKDLKILEEGSDENKEDSIEDDEDESLSDRVEDLLGVLKQEEESLEETLESDENDGAMDPNDEALMDKAVKDLRKEMKFERETGRKNLRGGDKGDSDE